MRETVYEFDLSKITRVLQAKYKLFLLIIALCGIVGFTFSKFLIPKTYTSKASVIIVPEDTNDNQAITYSDVQLSQKLVNTYSRIVMSETVGEKVLDNIGLTEEGYSIKDYKEIVSVVSSDDSEILDIVATTNNAELSAKIANEAVQVFSNQVFDIMNIRNVTILDSAKVSKEPSGPNLKLNTALGILVGMLISAALMLIQMHNDTKVKLEEEIKEILNYPVIGVIPEFNLEEKQEVAYGK